VKTVASGLREALTIGTQRASDGLSQPGGFSNDPLLRLALPHEFDEVASALRTVGFSKPVDDLEAHVADAALAGLLSELAEEEAPIRRDPAARTTEPLRRVFSR
jgi:hypothetical protein